MSMACLMTPALLHRSHHPTEQAEQRHPRKAPDGASCSISALGTFLRGPSVVAPPC